MLKQDGFVLSGHVRADVEKCWKQAVSSNDFLTSKLMNETLPSHRQYGNHRFLDDYLEKRRRLGCTRRGSWPIRLSTI